MFQEAERSAKLNIEDGLWFRVDAECDVDTAKARTEWPKCADWVIVRGNQALKSNDTKADEPPQDIFIVDGKPPLIQAKIQTNGSADSWGFLALEPRSYSPAGRITSAAVWMVPCGIDESTDAATPKIKPYPGMTEDCHPTTVAAIRASADKGPSKSSDVVRWTWVRAEAP